MYECKVILPYYDLIGEPLDKEHQDLRDALIRRFGYLMRDKTTCLWKDAQTGITVIHTCFVYIVMADIKDFQAFRILAKEYGRKLKQPHVYVKQGNNATLIDLSLMDRTVDKKAIDVVN